jgi:response regulator RpfG family c-di-GMP phosphodiesterase
MDIRMPEMDGVEATNYIRQTWPAEKQPRIIAMTADALPGDREHYLAAGMDDYVSKPIQVDELIRALTNVVPIRRGVAETGLSQEIVVDLHYLEDIIGDDLAILNRFVERFINELRLDIPKLKTAIDQADYKQLTLLAHSLKGNSAQMGAERLRSLFRVLEEESRDQALKDIATQLDQLEAESQRVIVALEAEMSARRSQVN